jgi:hypothetical protein
MTDHSSYRNEIQAQTASDVQIDVVCDRFEKAWRTGESPRIEDYLDELPAKRRAGLLLELILAELELRKKDPSPPNRDEYYRRFPGFQLQIDAAFTKKAPRQNPVGFGG